MKEPFKIDLRSQFANKSPRLAKFIPGFVYHWIEKIVHQKDMNRVLANTLHLKDEAFTKYIIENELQAKIKVSGIAEIPKNGGAIMVSNHPLGGLDGMILMLVASNVRSDVRVIVNDILAAIPNYDEIFVPVNKFGKNAKKSLQKIEEVYENGFLVMVFPAGLCSRKTKGIVKDLTWQKSFISRSIKYKLPVIPVHFSGQNSKRFYNIANCRKFFGIKTNIEMFFLVDELYLQKGKEFQITIGKAIPSETFNQNNSQSEWAELVKDHVYALKDNPQANFATKFDRSN